MDASTISIIAIVIAIGAVAYGFYASKRPITATTVATAIEALPSVVTEVEKAAGIVVNAYEQARRKGKLESDPSLNEVMNKVRGWLPDWAKTAVTNEQIIDAINSGILLASATTNQINANKRVAATIPPTLPGSR